MLITRTPLRISIGGGGTDLASYYERRGGFVIAGAIDKYIYVGMNRTFTDDYFIKYSALERTGSADGIDHPIVRTVLLEHRVGPGIELVSLADIPSGTGLGSSGAFAVGLLRAVHAFKREPIAPRDLAEEACYIENVLLARAGGKQDQYIASFGGLTCFEFHRDGAVDVAPLAVPTDTMHDLEDHLVMFFTGYSREADDILSDQRARSERDDADMLANLDEIKRIGYEAKHALEAGDPCKFGSLMHEHWLVKRGRTVGMSNEAIDRWYELAYTNGALGGKLVGAGAGGFLLFYAEEPSRVRKVLAGEGLAEVRFRFDHDGSSVVLRD